MDWIDQKELDGSIYNSLLIGNNGIICRICKRIKARPEDWDGTWFSILNVNNQCLTPEVYENKSLEELKRKSEEHVAKYNLDPLPVPGINEVKYYDSKG